MAVTEKRLHELESEVKQIGRRTSRLEGKSGDLPNGGAMKWNSTTFLPLGVSFLSLFVSAFALWFSSVMPADIKVSLNSPQFEYQHHRDTDEVVPIPNGKVFVRSKNSLLVVGTCAFANNGARTGIISEMVLQFVSDDGTKWTFLPYYIFDAAPTTVTDEKGHSVIYVGKASNFSSIILPGKQTAQHTVVFLSDEFVELSPHDFHVKLFTWLEGDKKPQEQQVSTLKLNDYVVATLLRENITGVPFDEQRERLKELK